MVVFPFFFAAKKSPRDLSVPGASGVLSGLSLSHPLVHAKAPGWHHDHQDKLHKDDDCVEIHGIDNLL
ncbi:hypothetical protein MSNKSG1_02248 [Marinobacter santoriniensis NKSG1]|uniref:Uncharacterized protein n=1 Tax=Marinobacter santoriniensis NKSG1 TaxID=1288826 RepID=M7CWA7_9GAMM|nr:hypothetical protein MSNKSG1_02248 [Marinobacter santoriniensis NKSG1]